MVSTFEQLLAEFKRLEPMAVAEPTRPLRKPDEDILLFVTAMIAIQASVVHFEKTVWI